MSALAAELTAIDLGDRRLNRRARRMLEKLGDKPTVSIPAACGGWGETRAAYRLFDHPEVTAEAVLAPCLSPVPRNACVSIAGCCALASSMSPKLPNTRSRITTRS